MSHVTESCWLLLISEHYAPNEGGKREAMRNTRKRNQQMNGINDDLDEMRIG